MLGKHDFLEDGEELIQPFKGMLERELVPASPRM